MELSGFASFLRNKCEVRQVDFREHGDFFPEILLRHVQRTWEQWLGPLVPKLPPFHVVIPPLQAEVAALISSKG